MAMQIMAKQSVKGMPMATQRLERKSRKMKSIIRIRTNPMEPLATTMESLFLKSTDSSSKVKSSIPVPFFLCFLGGGNFYRTFFLT